MLYRPTQIFTTKTAATMGAVTGIMQSKVALNKEISANSSNENVINYPGTKFKAIKQKLPIKNPTLSSQCNCRQPRKGTS